MSVSLGPGKAAAHASSGTKNKNKSKTEQYRTLHELLMFCILSLISIQITLAIFQVTNANINYQHIHLTSGLKVRQCLLRCTMEEHNMSHLSQIHP